MADTENDPVKKFPTTGSEETTQTDNSHRDQVSQYNAQDIVQATDSGPKYIRITELTHDRVLAEKFSWQRKWLILVIIFWVQISMNFNASIAGNAYEGIKNQWHVSDFAVRLTNFIFLFTYAFGCELWAPWSEEYGRRPVLQTSLFLVNVWQILCALSPNIATTQTGRAFAGLCSAGGSITLGIVADMYRAEKQGQPVALIVFSSVTGSAVGPFVGGFIDQQVREGTLSWRWIFWAQLIFGGIVQFAHYFTDETRSDVLLDRHAKKMREVDPKAYECHRGPGEIKQRMSLRNVLTFNKDTWKFIGSTWYRPFHMLFTEPIVGFLSLLSGFSDALIFTYFSAFPDIYAQYEWGPQEVGIALFVVLTAGYAVAWAAFSWMLHRQERVMENYGRNSLVPEERLKLLLWLAPLEPVGMLGFAFTTQPTYVSTPYASCFFFFLVAIANYAIYMATIDYMVASYGPYSASATGGNGFSRDLLAGFAALYAHPLYHNIGKDHFRNGSLVLAALASAVIIPVYFFYIYGESARRNSGFYHKIQQKIKEREDAEKETRALLNATNERLLATARANVAPLSGSNDPEKSNV